MGQIPRWVLVAVVLFALVQGLYALRGVLTPVFLAFLIAYMLDPLIDRFEARGIPRGLAIGVILTAVTALLAALLVLAVPVVTRDLAAFSRELPAALDRRYGDLEAWLREWGVTLPRSWSEIAQRLDLGIEQVAGAAYPVGTILRWLLGGTVSVVGAAAGLLLIPVFAAYLLHDFDRITAGIRDLVPSYWRPSVVEVAREIDGVLGAFVRGQLTVMLVLVVAYSVAYSLLGVRLAVLIGVVGGLLSFIPYVGGAVALGLAAIMCLFDWNGWAQLIGVVLAYGAIQTIEGFVITPRIVGDKVGLSAVWVLIALLSGGELFGFMGVLLALPAAAVLKIFVMRLLALYRSSEWYEGAKPPEEASTSLVSGILRVDPNSDDGEPRADPS